MRRARRGRRVSRPLLLFTLFFLVLFLLAGQVAAQKDDDDVAAPDDDKKDDDDTKPPAETKPPEETDDAPTPTDDENTPEPTDEKPTDDKPTDEPTDKPTDEPTDEPTDTDAQTTEEKTTEQPTETDKTTQIETTEAPTTESDSETATKTDSDTLSLPSLTGGPKIPDPTIPPTKGAPYLKESDMPEGTIFIAVGAALGFFAFAVFAWRGLVAWSINRSVRNTPVNATQSDATALLNPNKRKSRRVTGTPMSMEKLGNAKRHSALPPRSYPPNSSLFFSPTAGASMNTPGNRSSGYLPAGYYAASSAAPGGGGLGHVSNSSVGLSPLGPQAQGYSRTRSSGPSPPSSPGLPPSSRGYDQPHHQSTSSLNLTQPPQGRAPSAYLEDLFENHPPGR